MSFRLWGRRTGRTGALPIALGLLMAVVRTLTLSWRPSDRYPFGGIDVNEAQGHVGAAYGVTSGIQHPVWAVQAFFPPDYSARSWRMWQASDVRGIDGAAGAVRWNVVAP